MQSTSFYWRKDWSDLNEQQQESEISLVGGSNQLYNEVNKGHIIALGIFVIFICSTPHIYYMQDLDGLEKEILHVILPGMFGARWPVLLEIPFPIQSPKSLHSY